ncbi:DUF2180 family protein [Streptomyces sp. NPDC048172]|uniref:DUF2180 family protein n=1 Tax=Streptomyces sp. NPDC048172 TaxID=3365505 RepID=UPI003710D387
MRCLECREQKNQRDAIGVCQSCGAAVCASHAVIGTRRVRRGPRFGSPDEAEVRKVQCGACGALHAPVPGTVSW